LIPDPYNHDREGTDALVEGYYEIDLSRSGRVNIPVRIWYGRPRDPETFEPMDRSPRWQVQVGFTNLDYEPLEFAGIRIEQLSDVWPTVQKNPISRQKWSYMLERSEWAADYDDNDPFGEFGSKIDPMTALLP